MKVVYLTSDLLFSSRVRSIAQRAAVELLIVGSSDALLAETAAGDVGGIIVDLEHREAASLGELVQAVREQGRQLRVIAYGPHVKEALLQSARDAGCEVLSRGQFDQLAGKLVAELAASGSQ